MMGLRMSTATGEHAPPPELSFEEWAAMAEDEPGELIDGQLIAEEAPDLDHESIATWLVFASYGWVVPRGGFVFASEAKFAVRPKRWRKADVSVSPGSHLHQARTIGRRRSRATPARASRSAEPSHR